MDKKNLYRRFLAGFVGLFLIFATIGGFPSSGAAVSGLGKGPGSGKSLVKDPVAYNGEKVRVGICLRNTHTKTSRAMEKYFEKTYPGAQVEISWSYNQYSPQIEWMNIMVAAGEAEILIVEPVNINAMSSTLETFSSIEIPVVLMGGDSSNATTYPLNCAVTYDKNQAGKAIGNYVAQKLYNQGRIVSLTSKYAYGTKSYQNGINNVFSAHPDIKVPEEIATVNNPDTAKAIAERIYTQHGFLDAIVCEGNYMALGVCETLKEVGLVGLTIVTSVGGSNAILEEIRVGNISATMWEDYQSFAQTTVDAAMAIALGSQVAPSYNIPYHLVTSENVRLYQM